MSRTFQQGRGEGRGGGRQEFFVGSNDDSAAGMRRGHAGASPLALSRHLLATPLLLSGKLRPWQETHHDRASEYEHGENRGEDGKPLHAESLHSLFCLNNKLYKYHRFNKRTPDSSVFNDPSERNLRELFHSRSYRLSVTVLTSA